MKHPADPEERGEIRILFIAGNPTFQPVVTRFLKRCDELSLVGTVQGSERVLAQALDLRPQVILFDLDTSDRTGLAAIAELRAALPEASLVALSLLGADGYRRAVLAAGADDLVLKSSLRTDLLPAIRRAAQDGRHGQEHVF
jgi:NarL family two-component system response regulator LiaR